MASLALCSGALNLGARAALSGAPGGPHGAMAAVGSRSGIVPAHGGPQVASRRRVAVEASAAAGWQRESGKARRMSPAPLRAVQGESQEAAPSGKGGKGKGGKKKGGKKKGKGADAPAATSFRLPVAPDVGSFSEEDEPPAVLQVQEEEAAAASQAASSSSSSSSSNGSGASDRKVIALHNSTLTVMEDGSISISGEDAKKVLEALSAVGLVPTSLAAAAAGGEEEPAAAPLVDGGTFPAAAPLAEPVPVSKSAEVAYLTARATTIQEHFDTAMGADDFMQRVEMALYAFGFTGDNSIAMVNLCRDEVTVTLKQKIDAIFGASFSTNGLGGVLTCGTIGMGAGFSHSPVCGTTGKERYVFFSFPHISINSRGEVGPMSRPGRPGQSCACGALIKSWNEIKSEGLMVNCKIPGVHDAVNPEYSILKQRIARRLRYERATDDSVKQLSLVDLTKVAERTISDDLEFLISKTVETTKADYAVVTGVQIHNWATNFEDDSPNVEFVAPTSAYVVVNGVKTHIDLSAMPPLTPRQIRLLHGGDQDVVCNTGGQSTLREEDAPYAFDNKDTRKAQRLKLQRYLSLIKQEGLEDVAKVPPPASWHSQIIRAEPPRCAVADNSTVVDRESATKAAMELKEIQEMLQQKYREQQQTQS